jgi:hypothetical protein
MLARAYPAFYRPMILFQNIESPPVQIVAI